MRNKTKTKTNLLFLILFSLFLLAIFGVYSVLAEGKPEIKAKTFVDDQFSQVAFEKNAYPSFLNVVTKSRLTLDKKGGVYQPNKVYLSRIFEIDKSINPTAIGAYWTAKQPKGTWLLFYLRVSRDKKNWSDWQKLTISSDLNRPNGRRGEADKKTFSDLVFIDIFRQTQGIVKFFQYKAILSTNKNNLSPVLENISFVVIDADDKKELLRQKVLNVFNLFFKTRASSKAPKIISRAEWGADESLMTWPPEYINGPVKELIIHHTAAATNTPSNPAAVVRAIYYYHAVTRGWGDIGYNFIVDHLGNIYEGRKGGYRVIGAHAYGHNSISSGIAVNGNYMEEKISDSAFDGLTTIVAWLAFKYNIEPKNLPSTIVGHRDVGYTLCPGDKLYDQLSDIRKTSRKKLYTYLADKFKAGLVSQKIDKNSLLPGEEATIELKYKNTGLVEWDSSLVRLGIYEPKDSSSKFYASEDKNWLSPKRIKMKEKMVYPDEVATFEFKIKVPKKLPATKDYLAGKHIEVFAPVVEKITWIKTPASFEINILPVYQGKFVSQSIKKTKLKFGEKVKVKVIYQNLGNTVWDQKNTYLVLQNEENNKFNYKWIDNKKIPLSNKSVLPAEKASFIFYFKNNSPDNWAGNYLQQFKPIILAEDKENLIDSSVKFIVNVPAVISAELISKNKKYSLPAGEEQEVKIVYKNKGNNIWKKNSVYLVSVEKQCVEYKKYYYYFYNGYWYVYQGECQKYEDKITKSKFYHKTDKNWISSSKISFSQEEVRPGEEAHFVFRILVPSSKVGEKIESQFRLISGGKIFSQKIQISTVTIKPIYKAELINQSPATIEINQGDSTEVNVSFKNSSNFTWQPNNSPFTVKLGTSKKSQFIGYKDENWLSPTRIKLPIKVAKNTVGDFRFKLTVPAILAAGDYQQCFRLVAGSKKEVWFGPQVCWTIKVKAVEYAAQLLGQKTNNKKTTSVDLKMNESATLWLKLKNTGTATWYPDSQSAYYFILKNNSDTNLKDFFEPNWLSEVIVATVPKEILPGQTAEFSFTLTAKPQLPAGSYKISLSAGIKDVTSLSVTAEWQINVLPAYIAEFVDINKEKIEVEMNNRSKVTIHFRNTGNTLWENDKIFLSTNDPADHESIFFDPEDANWISFSRIKLKEKTVKNGEIATFEFNLFGHPVILAGDYNENWQLKNKNSYFGQKITLKIKVLPCYKAELVDQIKTVVLQPKQRSVLQVRYKNVGNVIWTQDKFFLATTNPNGRESQFFDSKSADWVNKKEIKMKTVSVMPGEVANFKFSVLSPDLGTGYYDEYFQPAVENLRLEGKIKFRIVVLKNPVIIKSEGVFYVEDKDKNMLVEVAAGKQVFISYDKKYYYLSAPNYINRFSSYLRAVPKDSAILQVVSYKDIASWDPSINDNLFRGVIEVRYSSTSGNLWVINELPLELYLRGIAETGPSAPYEHIKVMTVAARTYALWHIERGGKHYGEPFHLKNSRLGNGNDQTYKGYGLEKRFSTLTKAVKDTLGEVVTYQGKTAITPYFSCTDGRTRNPEEVGWYVDWPWVKSVPDPYGGGCIIGVNGNHGVGLSGRGSVGFAAQENRNYKWILKYYFTDVNITKVDTSNINIRVSIYGVKY